MTRTVAPPPATDEPRRRFAGRGWWAASALFVALIVVAGVYVVITGDGGSPRPPAGAPTSHVTATPGETTAPPAGSCPAALAVPIDSPVPTAAPDATWTPVGRVQAPASPTFGPIDGRCYEHSATGALFAAAHFLAAVTDPAGLQTAIRDLTVDGTGQQALLDLLAKDPTAVTGSGTGYQLAVSVVVRAGSGGMAAVPITLLWAEDSWLVQLPADGDLTRRATPLQTLTGFTPWSAR
jgi:hypothetical protein